MASAVIPSPRSLHSIYIAESTSNSEEPPAKRIRSSRSVASATACATVQPTVYQCLDKTKREIRICDLHSSSELSAPLICSLRIVPLDNVGKFIAFSYVWGQEPSTETITINGFQQKCRPNLATGLRRFRANYYQSSSGKRLKHRPIPVWADAIYINQDSIEERNHQVPLMRFIFSKCEYVFSWLREADSTSDLAMDSIARIATYEGRESTFSSHFHATLTKQGSPFFEATPWIAIRKLFEREFCYRVWIFQELVLPNKLNLACGSRYLSWTTFEVLDDLRVDIKHRHGDYKLLRRELAYLDLGTQDEVIAVCRIAQKFFGTFLYRSDYFDGLNCIRHTTHLKATDARDKIYGLLGLEENPKILPDYSKTTNQIYTEFATLMLGDDLTYLEYCGLSANGNNAELASWVPNWDHITRTKTAAPAPWRECLDAGGFFSDCLRHLRHVEFPCLATFKGVAYTGAAQV